MTTRPAHRFVAIAYDPVMQVVDRFMLGEHREALADGVEGRILDLGAGTGAMFPYLADAGAETVYAIEPDPYMRERAMARADESQLTVHFREGVAESLPYDDESFDTVIAAMVFCTIEDPAAAIDEIARVLRPGGELRFLEHVAADGWRGRMQRRVTPLWRRVAGGCHPHRDTGSVLLGHEAFEPVDIRRLSVGITPIRPFLFGRIKRRSGTFG